MKHNKRVLVAVSMAGTLKHYSFENFLKMAKACIDPVENVDIIFYCDKYTLDNYEIPYVTSLVGIGGNYWADDVIWETHEAALNTARNYNYDAVVFQGLDCFFKSEDDFRRLIASEEDIVGAVTMGRKEPEYAVVRDFVKVYDGISEHGRYTPRQIDVELNHWQHGLVPCNFPGTEACLINKQCFNIPIQHPKYVMWYEGNENQYLCVHEYWMLNAAREGFKAYVDTSIKVWHSDDSGWAHMWLEDSIKNEDLEW
jgi:hypothetical protein